MKRSNFVRGCFVVGLLAGCAKQSAGDPATDSPAQGSEARRGLVAKLNAYIGCLNTVNPAIRDNFKRYFDWAPPQKGPTLDGAGRGLSAITRETSYGYTCFQNRDAGLDHIGTLPAVPGLDEAGAAYKVALEEVMGAMGAAAEYYDHKDYKDDKLAKGKDHHKVLVEKLAKFDDATRALEDKIQTIQDKLGAERLAELEKREGKKARWHQSSVMQAADLLVRAATADAKVDPAKVTAAGEVYAKTFADAKAWTEANKAEADQEIAWGSFVRDADEMLTAWKDMRRSLRDAKQVPESGEGSVSALIGEYNGLVETSNGLWD